MQNFLTHLRTLAQQNPQKIVFPEGEDPRILHAIEKIVQQRVARPTLLGNPAKIASVIAKENLAISLDSITIIDPQNHDKKATYAQKLYERRKEKGMTQAEAEKLIQQPEYLGVMLVHENEAAGLVGGSTVATASSVKPALQIIKTKDQFHKVSGLFLMILEDKLLFFADCAIMINPDAHDLANIAVDTAQTALRFGIKPRVAFLSFSSLGSGQDEYAVKIREAKKLAREQRPDMIFEGELQVDAALVPEVASKKCPQSLIQGNANILIFPNLIAGNIAYKLVERLAKAHAVGPILQGFKKPINDLSRGCSVEDIVDITAFTVCEANELSYHQHFSS
jgi:phosphate acetyltransferase